MFNIGPGELVVILILALILLGPQRLPEVARTVGKGMRELRKATDEFKETVETEFYKLDRDPLSKPTLRAPEGKPVASGGGGPASLSLPEKSLPDPEGKAIERGES